MRLVTCQLPCKQDSSRCRGGVGTERKAKKEKKREKRRRKNMKMKKPACTACSQNGHDPSPKRSMNKQMLLVLWQYCRRKSYITSTGTAEGKAASHLLVLREEKLHVYWHCSRKAASHLLVLQQEKLHHIYRYCRRKSCITSTGTEARKTTRLLVLQQEKRHHIYSSSTQFVPSVRSSK